ncbi:MAG TPA: VTT domain-containing protein [Rhizomicrobium sp.]
MVKIVVRVLALALVLVGIVLAIVYRAQIDPRAIVNAIANNPLSPVIFIGLQIAASLLFVPRTVLGIAAGLLFGLAWGFVWAIIGAMAGAAAGFAFVRWMGVAGTLDTSPGVGKLVERAEQGGWRAVAIARLIPGPPHSVINTLLALTNLSWRDYLLGSLIGMAPITFVQVDIGASGGAVFQGHGGWIVGCVLLAVALAVSFMIKRVARRG